MNDFLWGTYAYLCLALFLVVPIVRMVYRPFGFSTRASGLFDRRRLGVASLLLHWGLFVLLLGHLAGFIGGLTGLGGWITFFYWAGLAGGIAALLGSGLALWRRLTVPEVRAMSRWDDYLVHWLLLAILGLGLYQVLVDRIFGVAYTASAWLATVARLSPQPELMDSATLVSKLHVLLAFLFFAIFPFTKLVHFWTYPVNYFVRPYQSMRTDRLVHRRQWEFRLRTDKSFLVYAAAGIALFFTASSAVLLGRAGAAAPAAMAGAGPPGAGPAALPGRTEAGGEPIRDGRLMGEALYVSQCARCHGLDGRGDGPGAASPTFAQPPRDLTRGAYRFVSTENGVASDADLTRTIREGLVSAGMPAFRELSDEQVRSLVDVLDRFWLNRPEAGATLELPPRPENVSAARGKELYLSLCATCHGTSGAGDGPAAQALSVPPARLAAGRLKAGADPEDLYWRIVAGIGRSGMPPFGSALTVEERWALIEYLRSELLPQGAARN